MIDWAACRAERKAHADAMLQAGREIWWAQLNEHARNYWMNRCGSIGESWEEWKQLDDDIVLIERAIRLLGKLPTA